MNMNSPCRTKDFFPSMKCCYQWIGLLCCWMLFFDCDHQVTAFTFNLAKKSVSSQVNKNNPNDNNNNNNKQNNSRSNSNNMNNMIQYPIKVLVTGAGGQTGRLVLKKLLEDDHRYEPKALVRTEKSAKSLLRGECKVPMEQMIISDITSPTFAKEMPTTAGLEGLDAMIICTSAVPRISQRSLAKAVLLAPVNLLLRKRPIDFRSLQFKWKYKASPEVVDYYGQRKQIDMAKQLGVKHVVLISSMGVTDRHHFLNNVGKNPDGTGDGDILVWKRKAERYLVESGLDYTIIHPGGLIDIPGGEQQLELDVDDQLFTKHRRTCMGREDLAELCVTALTVGKGKQISFDCIGHDIPEGNVRTETTESALQSFLEESKTANYR